VRAALGAGSWRLVRLWLAEAVLLSGAGAAVGIFLAWAGVRALRAAAPPGIPRLDAIALDVPVLWITGAATLLALVASALAPLSVARRRSLTLGLRAGASGSGDGPGRQAARTALVAAQCAGAAVLVVLAALLTRSFNNLVAVDLGWEAEGVLSLRAGPPMPSDLRRPWARYVEWSDRLIERLEATPGIEGAAITTQIPLSADTYPASVARGRGKGGSDDRRWPTVQHNVSQAYFRTMGIAPVSGRLFDESDRFSPAQLVDSTTRPPTGSAIVTESLARTLWPGAAAVGQAIWLPTIDNVAWRQVVGVVEDFDFYAVAEAPVHHVFVPWTQYPTGNPRLVVKGAGPGASLAPVVRAILQEVEPGTHVDQVIPLDALAARATAQSRFTSRVVALFGALALMLAGVGIHGTLAYVVRARVRDIGIRLALGASRRDILVRTLWNGLMPALAGGLLGTAAAVALARAFGTLLFDVSPLDARALAVGGLALVIVSVAAATGPARRAARVDPLVALRAE
jgi:predicted permease